MLTVSAIATPRSCPAGIAFELTRLTKSTSVASFLSKRQPFEWAGVMSRPPRLVIVGQRPRPRGFLAGCAQPPTPTGSARKQTSKSALLTQHTCHARSIPSAVRGGDHAEPDEPSG